MQAILALMPLVQSALAVFGAFKGTAAQAKADKAIQDALAIINAATPLIQSFGNGEEVTPDQVRASLAGSHVALDAYDAEIARQEAEDAAKK